MNDIIIVSRHHNCLFIFLYQSKAWIVSCASILAICYLAFFQPLYQLTIVDLSDWLQNAKVAQFYLHVMKSEEYDYYI